MADSAMREVPSAEFRVVYNRLTEPVIVTADGRPIGFYTPVDFGAIVRSQTEASSGAPLSGSAANTVPASAGLDASLTQAERDRVLRRVRGGK